MNSYDKIIKKGIFGFRTLTARDDNLPENITRIFLKETEASRNLQHQILLCEYSYKCKQGLSKQHYARVRNTHRALNKKYRLYNEGYIEL